MLIQQQRLASASEHSWLLFDLATGLRGLPAFGYQCEGHVFETENSLGDSVTIATQLHWVPTTPSLHYTKLLLATNDSKHCIMFKVASSYARFTRGCNLGHPPNSCDCLSGVVYYLCLDTFDILRPLYQYKHGNNCHQ